MTTPPVMVVGDFECRGIHGGNLGAESYDTPYTFSRVYPHVARRDNDDPGAWARCPVCHFIRYAIRERLALSPAAAGDLIRDTAFALREAIKPAPDLYAHRRGVADLDGFVSRTEWAEFLERFESVCSASADESAEMFGTLRRLEARAEALEAISHSPLTGAALADEVNAELGKIVARLVFLERARAESADNGTLIEALTQRVRVLEARKPPPLRGTA